MAAKESIGHVSNAPFSHYYVADENPNFVEANRIRLSNCVDASMITAHVGPAANTIDDVLSEINHYGLHFAFLDPYKLESLNFR